MCLTGGDSGPGFVWLYNTANWSCHKMQQELLDPPVACTFCDRASARQGLQLLVAPGPASALICFTVPHLLQVCSHFAQILSNSLQCCWAKLLCICDSFGMLYWKAIPCINTTASALGNLLRQCLLI